MKGRYCKYEDIDPTDEPFANGHFGSIWKVRVNGQENLCMKVMKVNVDKQFERLIYENYMFRNFTIFFSAIIKDLIREAVNMLDYNHDNVMQLSFISIDPKVYHFHL